MKRNIFIRHKQRGIIYLKRCNYIMASEGSAQIAVYRLEARSRASNRPALVYRLSMPAMRNLSLIGDRGEAGEDMV